MKKKNLLETENISFLLFQTKCKDAYLKNFLENFFIIISKINHLKEYLHTVKLCHGNI